VAVDRRSPQDWQLSRVSGVSAVASSEPRLCLFSLGECYWHGLGCDRDAAKVVKDVRLLIARKLWNESWAWSVIRHDAEQY